MSKESQKESFVTDSTKGVLGRSDGSTIAAILSAVESCPVPFEAVRGSGCGTGDSVGTSLLHTFVLVYESESEPESDTVDKAP